MAGRKREHLNERIRYKLGMLLQKEAGDPRFTGVTVTGVEVSPDGADARVYFAAYTAAAEPEVLEAGLNKAAGYLGLALGRNLGSRRTPRLHFRYDSGFDHAQRIDELLDEVNPEHG